MKKTRKTIANLLGISIASGILFGLVLPAGISAASTEIVAATLAFGGVAIWAIVEWFIKVIKEITE